MRAGRAAQPWLGLALGLGLALHAAALGCEHLFTCSGHGECDSASNTCTCHDGWGSASDIAFYKSPDCSARVCPAGLAWAHIPSSDSVGRVRTECSSAGACDRSTGRCRCFPGFEGGACQRSACPNACSGHGRCLSLKTAQTQRTTEPFGHSDGAYGGLPASVTWDEDRIFGCVCDSSWPVGYGSGERQASEWFGPDCSLRRCPSGDDPRTVSQSSATNHQWQNDENCFMKDKNGAVWRGNVDAEGNPDYPLIGVSDATIMTLIPATTYFTTNTATGTYKNVGSVGNRCHVDCSNRGLCDHSTGQCRCYKGYYGSACDKGDAKASGQL